MSNPEFETFDKAVRKILSVPPEELKRRMEEWRKKHGWARKKAESDKEKERTENV
jgi:hypothetical protein